MTDKNSVSSGDAAHRPLLGILFMILATSMFPFMGALVQVLSERYSSEQIIWARITAHLLFMIALFAPRKGIAIFATRQPLAQFARSCAQLTATSFYFFSIKFLHLAQATAITFTTPFMVTLLAWPMLGERLSPQRLLVMLVAFTGVLVIIRPGTDVFQWATIGVLMSSVSYAFYQVFTRRVGGTDPPETSAVYSALLPTIVMSVVVWFSWKSPETAVDAAMLIGLGVFGGLGHYCLARAMTYAPASVVSPFSYWQLIGASILGYLVTSRLPDPSTWVGAAIIVTAGLYMGWRETRVKPH